MGKKVTDIVHEILQRAMTRIAERYGLPDEVADIFNLIESEMKLEYGGQRVTVHPPRPDPQKKAAAVARDYLADIPIEEISSRHGISRRTLYRYLKR